MRNLRQILAVAGVAAGAAFASSPSEAVMIGNMDGSVDFPQGAVSFADAVVSYAPGSPLHPLTTDPTKALGVPDMTVAEALNCASLISCPFVSLGIGGTLVLQFTDNILTGSGNSNPDLYIFETGPIVQGTLVDISADGVHWSSVGGVAGSVRGIDIDAFGFGPASMFRFVRLIDDGIIDPSEVGESPEVLGADIDAVGAISTVVAPVPLPAAVWLLLSGLVGVGSIARRRR